jgi:hypothetical protein
VGELNTSRYRFQGGSQVTGYLIQDGAGVLPLGTRAAYLSNAFLGGGKNRSQEGDNDSQQRHGDE